MRRTAANSDVREIPADELWLGVIADKVVIATRSHDDEELVYVSRLGPDEARQMGEEMIRVAMVTFAPSN